MHTYSWRLWLVGSLVVSLALLSLATAPTEAAPGDPDRTFGTDGTGVIAVPGASASANALAVQPDGKIVVVGIAVYPDPAGDPPSDFALVRFNPDGSRDSTFGQDAVVTTDFGGNDSATSVAVQTDGKIVVAGVAFTGGFPRRYHDSRPMPATPSLPRIALARYNLDGSVDATFGSGGKLIATVGEASVVSSLVLQTDGKMLISGSTAVPDNLSSFSTRNAFLLRLNADGSRDPGFGEQGARLVPRRRGSGGEIASMIVQPDGKIVAAGTAPRLHVTVGGDSSLWGSVLGVARYNPDGSPDGDFADAGRLALRILYPGTVLSSEYAKTVALDPDGKIVLVGHSGFNTVLVRLNPDGSLDPTFGRNGKTSLRVGGGNWERSLAIQPDGKLLVASSFTLARFHSDGSLDRGFSEGSGSFRFREGMAATSIALQPDGQAVVGLTVASPGGSSLGVARYATAPSPTDETPLCVFRGDFKEIRDQIPEIVGDCLEDEAIESETGNLEQRATNGKLVRAKGSPWSLFTNSSHSWVRGPLGLVRRPNDEQFSWERLPLSGAQSVPMAESVPELGDVLFSDSLRVRGALFDWSCPSQLSYGRHTDEGYRMAVKGPCYPKSVPASSISSVRSLTMRDGEVRFDMKAVDGIDRARFDLWLRYEPGVAYYQLTVIPALRTIRLGLWTQDKFTTLSGDIFGEEFKFLDPEGWNSYAVRMQGANFWVFLNEVLVLSGTNPQYDSGEVVLNLDRAPGYGPDGNKRVEDSEDMVETTVLLRNLSVSALANSDPDRSPTYLASPAVLPGPGATVLTDPLTKPGYIAGGSCPTQRGGSKLGPDGLVIQVAGPCFDDVENAFESVRIQALTFGDGEVRFDLKALSGLERMKFEVWLRYQPGRGFYGFDLKPGTGEAELYLFQNQGGRRRLDRRSDLQLRIGAGEWHNVIVRAQGPDLQVLLNNELLLTGSEPTLALDSGQVILGLGRSGPPEDEQESMVVLRDLRVSALEGGDPARAPRIEPPKMGNIYFSTSAEWNRRSETNRDSVPLNAGEIYGYYEFADVVPPNTLRAYWLSPGSPDTPISDGGVYVPRLATNTGRRVLNFSEPGIYTFVVELNGEEAARRELLVEP